MPPRVEWFTPAQMGRKRAHAMGVYRLLEEAYRSIGGINKGTGFSSADEMVEKIPVWRLVFVEGRMVSATMFKKPEGLLKMVAYAAQPGTPEDIKQSDIACFLSASHAELSGPLLFKVLKHLRSRWRDFVLDPKVSLPGRETFGIKEFGRDRLLDEENAGTLQKLEREYGDVMEFGYVREIGGSYKFKVLFGSFPEGSMGGEALHSSVCGHVQTPQSSFAPLCLGN